MKAVTAAAALVYGLSTAPAFAYMYDGNQLWENCHEGTNMGRGFCYGYIASVADSQKAFMAKGTYHFCTPSEATLGQLSDVVKKYLGNHPQDRHHPATFLVIQALMEAFPCKR